MVGNDLKKQPGAFRNAGAPNLDKVSARSKFADLKIALIGVEDPEDKGEFIDLDVVEDDDACEWEDDDDL